jgi:hypothetical protein
MAIGFHGQGHVHAQDGVALEGEGIGVAVLVLEFFPDLLPVLAGSRAIAYAYVVN